MNQPFYYILPAILLAGFVADRWLEFLNHQSARRPLPEKLRTLFDAKAYARQQEYQHANYRFEALTAKITFLVMMSMLLFHGFALVNDLAATLTSHPLFLPLVFTGILTLGSALLHLPFTMYDTFVIEERFGFNRTTPKTFVTDHLKSLLLTLILGGGLLALIIAIYLETGRWFWLLAWGTMGMVSLLGSLLYSSLIVPLFNKQTPLPDGELRTAIESFTARAGFRLSQIFLIDGSKRSSKANAYFTGWGPRKRIVLYDTLLDEMTTPEIVAILAHETGHYKKRHLLTGLIAGLLQSGVMLFLFSRVVESRALSQGLGIDQPAFHTGLIAFGILFSPLSLLTGMATHYLSRKHEFEADNFAADHGMALPLMSALKKLAVKNLTNMTPHPLYVFVNYSHPPLPRRLDNLEKRI
ncbi:MAG: M48 family metallopeptidase [Prolixibacteraceae bacterium]|nr:M48 family metallopeptidase [Prolixibacteraceae bacterium]